MDVNEIEVVDFEVVKVNTDYDENIVRGVYLSFNQIDSLPNNDKLGEYVRSLRNNL